MERKEEEEEEKKVSWTFKKDKIWYQTTLTKVEGTDVQLETVKLDNHLEGAEDVPFRFSEGTLNLAALNMLEMLHDSWGLPDELEEAIRYICMNCYETRKQIEEDSKYCTRSWVDAFLYQYGYHYRWF